MRSTIHETQQKTAILLVFFAWDVEKARFVAGKHGLAPQKAGNTGVFEAVDG